MKKNYLAKSFILATIMFFTAFSVVNAQVFTVDAPASIAGQYTVGTPLFGPQFSGFSGTVVPATDVDGLTTACVGLDNGVADVTGAVALVDRGACAFTAKAAAAQDAGAIAVIVCNNDTDNPDDVINLGGTDGCVTTIPAVMLSFNACQAIRMETGVTVTYTAPGIPDPGTNFATAIDITDGTHTVDSLYGGGGIYANSVSAAWYTYTPSADGVLSISSCEGGVDTRLILSVSPGGCVGDVQIVAFNDDAGDACAADPYSSVMEALVFAGQEYLIIWDDPWSTEGFDFTVELQALPTVPITFTVNMEQETVSADGVWMSYEINGPPPADLQLTDNGDGTYSGTIDMTTLDVIDYAYTNGLPTDIANVEAVPAECAIDDPNAVLPVRTFTNTAIAEAALAPVCFGLCTNCPAVNVTYTVDMTNTGASADGVNMVIGAPGVSDINDVITVPMTDNADGTWSATLPMMTGDTIGYAFVNGMVDPANLEMVPAECGVPSGFGFNVRPQIITGFEDYSVDVVCFSECGTCPPLGCGTFVVFEDNIDSYATGGTTGPNADWWTTWGGTEGGADDGIVSDDFAASAPNSMLIAEGQTQDVLLLLGNRTSGAYRLDWKEYVPAGATAYFNIQEDETPGVAWNLDVQFNQGSGSPGTGSIDQTGTTFAYPEDAWFDVSIIVDMDAKVLTLIIDGTVVEGLYTYPGAQLGGINFFSIDAANRYYIDDVVFTELAPIADVCGDAVFAEGLEAYASGDASGPESGVLTTWGGTEGGADDGIVTSDQAHSGCNSMYIAQGQTQDVLLLLGNETAGHHKVSWWTYIPTGATAYWNIQEDEMPGVQWNVEVFYNQNNGSPGTGLIQDTGNTFSYPEDEWFQVVVTVDLDNAVSTISIDGVVVESAYAYPGVQLGSINFFSTDDDNQYYIDDMVKQALPSCLTGVNSLICDPVEYAEGPIGPSSDHWTTWGGVEGGADDGIVSTDQANSGCTSMYIAEGQTQDVLLLLGNQTSGRYQLRWFEYVPTGATAYWNIQEDETPGIQWNIEVYFNQANGSPGMGSVQNTGNTFTYPEDQWFEVSMIVDLDNASMELTIDGTVVEAAYAYPGVQLGSINFFSADDDNRYYIDDVSYVQLESLAATQMVTFQVDATLLVDAGELAADGMHIAGAFNDFNGQPMTEGADNVWSITLELDANTSYEYKFQNGLGGWEEIDTSIGDDCTVGGYGNRQVEVAGMDMTLDVVCFAYCVMCNEVPSSVDNETLQASVSVFPNPASDMLSVQIDLPEAAENMNIRLVNTFGQVVSEQYLGQLQSDMIELDLSKVPAGAYMLQVRDGQSQHTQSVIVQK